MDGVLFIIWIISVVAAIVMFRLGMDARDGSTDPSKPAGRSSI